MRIPAVFKTSISPGEYTGACGDADDAVAVARWDGGCAPGTANGFSPMAFFI